MILQRFFLSFIGNTHTFAHNSINNQSCLHETNSTHRPISYCRFKHGDGLCLTWHMQLRQSLRKRASM